MDDDESSLHKAIERARALGEPCSRLAYRIRAARKEAPETVAELQAEYGELAEAREAAMRQAWLDYYRAYSEPGAEPESLEAAARLFRRRWRSAPEPQR
jgi:hypothetical protein